MPLISPLPKLVFSTPIPLLNFADELLRITFDLRQIVIGKFSILLFQFTFELFPFPLELICMMSPSCVNMCAPPGQCLIFTYGQILALTQAEIRSKLLNVLVDSYRELPYEDEPN